MYMVMCNLVQNDKFQNDASELLFNTTTETGTLFLIFDNVSECLVMHHNFLTNISNRYIFLHHFFTFLSNDALTTKGVQPIACTVIFLLSLEYYISVIC